MNGVRSDSHKVGLVPIPAGDTGSLPKRGRPAVVSLGRGGPTGNVPWVATGAVYEFSLDTSTQFVSEMLTTMASKQLRAGCPLIDTTGHLVGVVGITCDSYGASLNPTYPYDHRDAAVGVGYFQQCAADYEQQAAKQPAVLLGVRVRSVTPRLAAVLGLRTTRGALVEFVVPDNPAARAGVKGGTRVVSVGREVSGEWERELLKMTNGTDFEDWQPGTCIAGGDVIVGLDRWPVKSASGLALVTYDRLNAKPGQVVTLHLVRNGKPLTVKAKFGPNLLWDYNWQ